MSWFTEMLKGVRQQRNPPAPEPTVEVDGIAYTAADVRELLAERQRLIREHEARVIALQEALYEASMMIVEGTSSKE